MNIIARCTLEKCWKKHPDSKSSLEAWYAEMTRDSFLTPQDIKERYGSADILRDNRVVFNIKGKKYRLVVAFNYSKQIGFIRFVGTHSEYSKINAEEI